MTNYMTARLAGHWVVITYDYQPQEISRDHFAPASVDVTEIEPVEDDVTLEEIRGGLSDKYWHELLMDAVCNGTNY